MEIFVWLEVMPDLVELKCAIITYGGQCVIIDGVSRMLECMVCRQLGLPTSCEYQH